MRILSILLLSLIISLSPATFLRADNKPQSKSAELNEQGVQAMKSKNNPAAEQIFKRAVAADPYNLTAVFNLAAAYLGNKKYKDAVELLEPYAEKQVDDAGIYTRLGDAYFASKKIDKAKEMYLHAVKLAPNYLGLQAKLGTMYALNNDLTNAEKAYRLAVEHNQKDGPSLANLAAVLLGLGKAEESIQTAKRALQVDSNPEIYVTMGNAYEQLKDKKNALISFQRAHDLGITKKELTDKIEQLKAN